MQNLFAMADVLQVKSTVPVSTLIEIVNHKSYSELHNFLQECKNMKGKKRSDPSKVKQDLLEKLRLTRARCFKFPLLFLLMYRNTGTQVCLRSYAGGGTIWQTP